MRVVAGDGRLVTVDSFLLVFVITVITEGCGKVNVITEGCGKVNVITEGCGKVKCTTPLWKFDLCQPRDTEMQPHPSACRPASPPILIRARRALKVPQVAL